MSEYRLPATDAEIAEWLKTHGTVDMPYGTIGQDRIERLAQRVRADTTAHGLSEDSYEERLAWMERRISVLKRERDLAREAERAATDLCARALDGGSRATATNLITELRAQCRTYREELKRYEAFFASFKELAE